MPNELNCSVEMIDGQLIEKPLLITISLEEYRSLVQENTRYSERVVYLENRICELNAPKGCVNIAE